MTRTNDKQDVKVKNSLIELFRFLFALWVLYYHDYVPYKGEMFGQGYLAVEFFFVLSGFFLMRSMEKCTQRTTKEGLLSFLKHRFKGIAIPFIIGEIFVLIYSFAFEVSYNFFFGYLWYVRDLFLAMVGIFFLRKCVRNEKCFYIVLAIVSLITFFGFSWLPIFAWPSGPFRSAAAIPLGIFTALIPRITYQGKANIGVAIAGLLFTAFGCFFIISLPDKDLLLSYLLVIIGYPSLIYFTNQIQFHNKFLDWLGSLSFPIYAFQCILRVIEAFGLNDNRWLFVILMALVLTYSLTTYILKVSKQKFFNI